MPANGKLVRDKLDTSFKGMVKEAIVSLIEPKQIELPQIHLPIVEEDLSLNRYLFYGAVFTILGYLIMFGGVSFTYFGYFIVTFITPAILFAWLFHISPNRSQRIPIYVLCFGWGAFSGILACPINSAIGNDYLQKLVAAIVEEALTIIPMVEVGVKELTVRYSQLDEPSLMDDKEETLQVPLLICGTPVEPEVSRPVPP